jgi:hypothetical protein
VVASLPHEARSEDLSASDRQAGLEREAARQREQESAVAAVGHVGAAGTTVDQQERIGALVLLDRPHEIPEIVPEDPVAVLEHERIAVEERLTCHENGRQVVRAIGAQVLPTPRLTPRPQRSAPRHRL